MGSTKPRVWLVTSLVLCLHIPGCYVAAVYAPRSLFCIPGPTVRNDKMTERQAAALTEVVNGDFGSENAIIPSHGRWVEAQSYAFPSGLRLSTLAAGRAIGNVRDTGIDQPFMDKEEMKLCLRAGVVAFIMCPPGTVQGFTYLFDTARPKPPVMFVDPDMCLNPEAFETAKCFVGFTEGPAEAFLDAAFACPIPGCYFNYPHVTLTL